MYSWALIATVSRVVETQLIQCSHRCFCFYAISFQQVTRCQGFFFFFFLHLLRQQLQLSSRSHVFSSEQISFPERSAAAK